MARHKGRILAFQAIFSWEMGHIAQTDLLEFPWLDENSLEKIKPAGLDFARMLVSGTIEHIDEIDDLIKKYLDSWEFERINKVDIAVLRISIYSLLYQQDIHPTIIINEAIDIAKEFGSGDSYRFVNAVLDNIRKELNR